MICVIFINPTEMFSLFALFFSLSACIRLSLCMQVTEFTAKELEPKFDFEHRGTVFVKGKGEMNTYLLVSKKADAVWE